MKKEQTTLKILDIKTRKKRMFFIHEEPFPLTGLLTQSKILKYKRNDIG